METVTTHMKSTEKQLEQSKKKINKKKTLSLPFSITQVREYTVPGVKSGHHVSVDKSGRLWVNDNKGRSTGESASEDIDQCRNSRLQT